MPPRNTLLWYSLWLNVGLIGEAWNSAQKFWTKYQQWEWDGWYWLTHRKRRLGQNTTETEIGTKASFRLDIIRSSGKVQTGQSQLKLQDIGHAVGSKTLESKSVWKVKHNNRQLLSFQIGKHRSGQHDGWWRGGGFSRWPSTNDRTQQTGQPYLMLWTLQVEMYCC